MKIAQIKNDLLNWRKLSLQKIAKYVGLIFGSIILLCVLNIRFLSGSFYQQFIKRPDYKSAYRNISGRFN